MERHRNLDRWILRKNDEIHILGGKSKKKPKNSKRTNFIEKSWKIHFPAKIDEKHVFSEENWRNFIERSIYMGKNLKPTYFLDKNW